MSHSCAVCGKPLSEARDTLGLTYCSGRCRRAAQMKSARQDIAKPEAPSRGAVS